ncbi:MAG: VWA domain-containing protein [Anaerolineales bacterium]|jgi:VWFA-related protein
MRHKSIARLIMAIIAIIAMALPSWAVLAQASVNLAITEVDDSAFPQVAALVTVSDEVGLPVTGLSELAFTLTEDDVPVEDFTVAEFQNTEEPIAFALAVDTSGSMIGDALADTVLAAEGFIEGLVPADQVGLITFDDEARTIAELTQDKESVVQAVRELTAGGYTAMYDAIVMACNMLRDSTTGRRAIVLITDGENVRGEVRDVDTALLCPLQETIPIYTIGFGGDIDAAMLHSISEQTGGIDQVKPGSEGMMAEFARVLQHLRHQYRLEFDSSFLADNAGHTLTVAVDHGGMHAEAAADFVGRAVEMSISVIGLQDGQDVGGAVDLEVDVEAPGDVLPINLLLDGEALATVSQEDPLYTWDTMPLAEGEYVLTVQAADDIGNIGSREYRLNVRRPVRITWQSPVAGDDISGSILLTIVIDSMAGVANVDYYADGGLLGTATEAPFTFEWDLAGVSPGSHVLRAVATDVNTYTAEAEISITVAITSNTWIAALAVAILIAAALLIIPLAARKRRGMAPATAAPAKVVAGAPAPVVAASIMELEGVNPGREWPLGQEDVKIGRRREDNDIQAAGLSASRNHAVIQFLEGQYVLRDLRPDNPSYVNGQPVYEQCILAMGDTIQIGESVFRFQAKT